MAVEQDQQLSQLLKIETPTHNLDLNTVSVHLLFYIQKLFAVSLLVDFQHTLADDIDPFIIRGAFCLIFAYVFMAEF